MTDALIGLVALPLAGALADAAAAALATALVIVLGVAITASAVTLLYGVATQGALQLRTRRLDSRAGYRAARRWSVRPAADDDRLVVLAASVYASAYFGEDVRTQPVLAACGCCCGRR